MNENTQEKAPPATVPKEADAYFMNRDYICVLIAVVQILGGLFGIWITLESEQQMSTHVIQGLLLIPFPWGVYAGYLLLRNRPRGITHSLIIQLLQIAVIASVPFSYTLFLGIHFSVGTFGGGWGFQWLYGAGSYINIGMGYSPPGVAINLIALSAFAYLVWVKFRREVPGGGSAVESYERENH